MEPGTSETLTMWKKAEITYHQGIMQHFRDRVLRKHMVPKRNRCRHLGAECAKEVEGWCSGCVGGQMARLCKSTNSVLYCPRIS